MHPRATWRSCLSSCHGRCKISRFHMCELSANLPSSSCRCSPDSQSHMVDAPLYSWWTELFHQLRTFLPVNLISNGKTYCLFDWSDVTQWQFQALIFDKVNDTMGCQQNIAPLKLWRLPNQFQYEHFSMIWINGTYELSWKLIFSWCSLR